MRQTEEIHRGAVFGPGGPERSLYRYELTRLWNPDGDRVCWIMLNPSTADGNVDDPTIRRVIDFSRRWGYGSLVVVNLYAYRATNPKLLNNLIVRDAIGYENDKHILAAAGNSKMIVAAWGAHKPAKERGQDVLRMLQGQGIAVQAVHLTSDGTPCHPLYLPKELVPFAIGGSQ